MEVRQPDAPGPTVTHWLAGIEAARRAPRCRAMRKHGFGPCLAPAALGTDVCRVHGAGGGAPCGPANPRWIHGARSRGAAETQRQLRQAVKVLEAVGLLLKAPR